MKDPDEKAAQTNSRVLFASDCIGPEVEKAANELRSEGYNVPRIAPFLDPPITWAIRPPIDLATQAGKDEFVKQYQDFFLKY